VSESIEPPRARTPSEWLTLWLVRRRWPVLIAAVFLTLAAGWRTLETYGALRGELEELLPESAPSVGAIERVRARMFTPRHLGIVVDTGGVANLPAAERFIDDLARRIETYSPSIVSAVRTGSSEERRFLETYALQLMEPTDVARLVAAAEERRDWEIARRSGLDLLDAEQDPPPEIPLEELSKKYLAAHAAPRASEQATRDRFVSADGRTTVLLIQTHSQGASLDTEHGFMQHVDADARALGFPDAYASGMRFGFAGDVATRVQELSGLKNDLGISGVLVSLLVVTALFAYFRSWRALPILGFPLLCGTSAAFALVALPPLSIRHLNSNTAFLGSIVVGNGINSGVILLARFWEERRNGAALEPAIATALHTTWRPTLAAALAAAAAYGSLIFTDFRGFNQFGWIGALGMLVCWLYAMLLIPPLCSLFGSPLRAERANGSARAGARFSLSVLGRARSLLLLTLALGVISAIGIARRHGDFFEYDFSKLRRSDSWASGERYWGKRMDATLQRYLTPTLILTDDAKQAAQVEARIEQLKREDRAGGLIANVRSLRDLLPDYRLRSLEEARKLKQVLTPRLRAALSGAERRYVDSALSDAALTPLRADQIPESLLAGLREHDGSSDRSVLIFPQLDAATWNARRIDAYAADLRKAAEFGKTPVPVAGSLLLSSDIVSAIQTDGPRATLIAAFALLVVCGLSFRSLGLSLAALFSIGAGVVLTLGAMAWSGERLNFSNFVVLPITFGIAADYSINMLKRFQAERRGDLGAALTATGGAVTLCSITTIIGYGSLLVAQNRALFSFGLFAIAGEIACLVTAILALPAGLVLAKRLRGVASSHAA
jgi:uncharacterized protein